MKDDRSDVDAKGAKLRAEHPRDPGKLPGWSPVGLQDGVSVIIDTKLRTHFEGADRGL